MHTNENLARVKEVMGDTFDDHCIIKALTLNQNDFERAINYLLEPPQLADHPPPPPQQPQHQLRQSITDAFTTSPLTYPSNWASNSNWTQPPPAHPPPVDNFIQPVLDPLNEAREPLVLPNSPPKGSYQPLTVTGQTTPTEDFRISDQPIQILNHPPIQPTQNPINTGASNPNSHLGTSTTSLEHQSTNTACIQLIDDNPETRYEADLNAAIQASLVYDPALNQLHPSSLPKLDPKTLEELKYFSDPKHVEDLKLKQLKSISAEDEQMSKALEESLAMSGSRTLEAEGKFSHPPANNRLRPAGSPTALRVHNPHLVFLPCLLSAMYAAKPFRDRILAFEPNTKFVDQDLIDHDFQGIWNGKSSWRSGENWPEKAQSAEIILAIQRLFILMTHTNRSYLDVQEISSLLGYEEGEMISWSLNEPNKGCHRTYETIAEAWRELTWEIFKLDHPEFHDQDHQKLLSEFEGEQRLLHWKGHKLPLPLPADDTTTESLLMPSADNSTTSLTLNTLDSTLNDIYSCIDAQVWLPESNQAHFLNGLSEVIAFEIDRKSSSSSAWCSPSNHELLSPYVELNSIKSPFKLQSEFWVDRYLIQNRHKIIELREEISRIEGEADVSLARRTQLSKAGDKDLFSTLKATVDYLSVSSQFPTEDILQREKVKKEMLPKFQESLKRLEAELASLDEKAKTALAAAKGIFDVDEMKQVGPHELCSVVVSDGFSGRDHMWTYTKTDDGRWYKSIDQTVTEVSLETVLSDPAGIHMNSGHIFAIYVRKPNADEIQTESQSIPLPARFEKSVVKDNELLEAEILESTTMNQSGSGGYNADLPIEHKDIEMTTDSPRSDVADAGGPFDLDLIETDQIDVGPPIRLYGGAKFIPSDHNHDQSDDDDLGSCDSGSERTSDDDLVELGFLKKITKPLNVKSFTGKVGGHPIWLDPSSPLDTGSITCSGCQQSLKFLLQLNAPDDSNPDAYYRTIYVYVCPRSACWNDSSSTANKILTGASSGRSVKVFRTQLGSQDFDNRSLKINKKLPPPPSNSSTPFFREWEIVCDLEPLNVNDNLQLEALKHLESSNPLVDKLKLFALEDSKKKSGNVVVDQDSNCKETKSKVDDEFLNFQSRITRAPNQILRYLRVKVPEIEPIWVNKITREEEEVKKKIQVCRNCGGKRTAEFQILSTLISQLEHGVQVPGGQEEDKEDDGIDFGSIVVYTCSNSCSSFPSNHHIYSSHDHDDDTQGRLTNNCNWVEESCLVQFFSNHGIFS